PGEVGGTRQQTQQVSEENKEEKCEQVRQVTLVLWTDVRLNDLVLHKNDHRLHERLDTLGGFTLVCLVSPCGRQEDEKNNARIDEQHRHVLGDRKIEHSFAAVCQINVLVLQFVAVVFDRVVMLVKEVICRKDIQSLLLAVHNYGQDKH